MKCHFVLLARLQNFLVEHIKTFLVRMRTLFEYHIPFVVYKSERQMPYGTSKWYKPFQIQKSTDDVVNLLFENNHPKHEVARRISPHSITYALQGKQLKNYKT